MDTKTEVSFVGKAKEYDETHALLEVTSSDSSPSRGGGRLSAAREEDVSSRGDAIVELLITDALDDTQLRVLSFKLPTVLAETVGCVRIAETMLLLTPWPIPLLLPDPTPREEGNPFVDS